MVVLSIIKLIIRDLMSGKPQSEQYLDFDDSKRTGNATVKSVSLIGQVWNSSRQVAKTALV